jgi:hypothetical protein
MDSSARSASPRELPRLQATRYVQPLREGGSMPAIVETDDGLFVAKFRGAGQGARALIAEILVARIAQEIGLPVPDLALIDLASEFGRSEPDPEIQDLLRASHGINVGLRFLDGAFNFDSAAAGEFIDAQFASRLVWLDAFTTNVDRTHRNPNLLIWNRTPWLIDHGAALYAHHNWDALDDVRTRTPFPLISQHVLLTRATDLESIDDSIAQRLTSERISDIVQQIPVELLQDDADRDRYVRYLTARLEGPRAFVAEAAAARERAAVTPQPKLRARR